MSAGISAFFFFSTCQVKVEVQWRLRTIVVRTLISSIYVYHLEKVIKISPDPNLLSELVFCFCISSPCYSDPHQCLKTPALPTCYPTQLVSGSLIKALGLFIRCWRNDVYWWRFQKASFGTTSGHMMKICLQTSLALFAIFQCQMVIYSQISTIFILLKN